MACVQALQEASRSPSPDYEDYEDIPEVPEVYEDIPAFETTPELEVIHPVQISEGSSKLCSAIVASPPKVHDENFNVNKEQLDFSNPDALECMHSSVGVKALRDRLNKMASDSPARDFSPNKSCTSAVTTREVRTHLQQAFPNATPTKQNENSESSDDTLHEKFPSPPIREKFDELDAGKCSAASDDKIGGLQMSSEHSESDEEENKADQENVIGFEENAYFQNCDPTDSIQSNEVVDDRYLDLQRGTVDFTAPKSLESVVKIFSEGNHDSQRLVPVDHARATLSAMKEKCIARLPAPPTKLQAYDAEEEEAQYSNEDIQAIADVLLNPAKKAVVEMPRTATPSKINGLLREALQDIHYSPSPRASAMLQKLRQKELLCKKVPTPKVPRGSVSGLQPGRSLMPVAGLQAANMAALATVNASMSPHLKNNTQHSRRSKMPSKGAQAADRAALADLTSTKTRKLALFQQGMSPADAELQKQKWAEYVSKYGAKDEDVFEDNSKKEGISAPSFVSDDSQYIQNTSAVIDGLQDSIDGLQASFSSDEGEENAEYIEDNDGHADAYFDQDASSDDEIFPEETPQEIVDHDVQEKIDTIHKNQSKVEEIGRKVMVLSQRVNQDRGGSPQSDRQMMGDASTLLEVEDMGKMQKILDLFDVISQTVCDSDENLSGGTASFDSNKLMAEIISLRAGQLALIQDDHTYSLQSIEEVKQSFSQLGFKKCHGLLDQASKLIAVEQTAHDTRQVQLAHAIRLHSQQEIQQHHGKRGESILKSARAALLHSRFDHALAFIVKAKRAFSESDKVAMLQVLEDLNRKVVMEATRMASDSLILEATRISSSNSGNASVTRPSCLSSTTSPMSDTTESTVSSRVFTEAFNHAPASTEGDTDALEALFSPSDATSKLLARIVNGGKVALNQGHDELEDEIQRLRNGLEALKADEIVPLHRKNYIPAAPSKVAAFTSVAMSPHARRAQESHQNSSSVQSEQVRNMSVHIMPGNDSVPLDKELQISPPISVRRESRQGLDEFLNSDRASLKATSPYSGGMVGTAMALPTVASGHGEWET